MQLNNVDNEAVGAGVEVCAFNEDEDGVLGQAEQSGEVRVGDLVIGVNGSSTNDLDYVAVLDLIINAPRPITLRFERQHADDDMPQLATSYEEGTGDAVKEEDDNAEHAQGESKGDVDTAPMEGEGCVVA